MSKSAPDKESLVEQLINNHEATLGEGHRFILCGQRPDKTPFFMGMDSSLDVDFMDTLTETVGEEFDGASDEEKAQISKRVFSATYPDLVALMKSSAVAATEREACRHLPILPFDDLESSESENLVMLLQEARDKAEHLELSAFQLFIEGKLETLMSGNPRMDAFNQLSDYKKKQARRQLIERMSLEKYYTA